MLQNSVLEKLNNYSKFTQLLYKNKGWIMFFIRQNQLVILNVAHNL